MISLRNINTENKYDETDEKKLKIADVMSIVTNPPIITIPLFLIICIGISSTIMGILTGEFCSCM